MFTSPVTSARARRYDRETLEVKYREKSIADVLDMTVEEARELFKAVPGIREKMETLKRVGLDYVPRRPAGHHSLGWRSATRKNCRRNCRAAPRGAHSTFSTSRPPACTSTT